MNTKRMDGQRHDFTKDDLPQGLRDDFELDASDEDEEQDLSHLIGSGTGEAERAIVAGGWEGTDDATSTAPSDLDPTFTRLPHGEGPEDLRVPELAAGIGIDGAITDIKGTPVDESRDWNDPIISEP